MMLSFRTLIVLFSVTHVLWQPSNLVDSAEVVDSSQFEENDQWNGAAQCTKLAFASTGEIFCGQKRGDIIVYPSATASASQATLVWSLGDVTHTWADRGLLGMVLHEDYPATPYIWIVVSVNHVEDLSVPDTTFVNPSSETCSSTPANYCSGAARFIRIRIDTSTNLGTTEQILISDWCAASGSHHIGDLVWAGDGGLYLSSGDGASFTFDDYGVDTDICYNANDARDQGAYRSQWDDYIHGKILYFDETALMVSGRQLTLAGGDYRIVAKGLRNPFRFARHPTSGDLYIGDVGSEYFEEINRVPNPLAPGATVPNFGWPCFEGLDRHPSLADRDLCNTLVQTEPFFTYSRHVPLETENSNECSRANVSPAAFAFRTDKTWGDEWENVLFWADSSLRCIFYFENTNGQPDATKLHTLVYTAGDENGKWIGLYFGTGSDERKLFALEFDTSTMFVITYTGDIIIDPNVPSYTVSGCQLAVDDFESSSNFDNNLNLVPGPGDTQCSTSKSSNMDSDRDDNKLVLKASSASDYYTTDFAYGDRCFDANSLSITYLQFDVEGDYGSMDVVLLVKNADCNSVDTTAPTQARFWGGFSNSGTSTVTIPLSVFGGNLGQIQGVKFQNLSPLDNDIKVDNIFLAQSCAIDVPTFEPTLCELSIDEFSSSTVNSFGLAPIASEDMSASYANGQATLSSSDTDAEYTLPIFNSGTGFCSDFSFYDSVQVTYVGSAFKLYFTTRASNCEAESSASTDINRSSAAQFTEVTSFTTAIVKLSDFGVDASNVHSVIISGISGETQFDQIKLSRTSCNAGTEQSSGLEWWVILIIALSGTLVVLGCAGFCMRRRHVSRGSPRNKGARDRRHQFDAPRTPQSSNLRSRPISVRNRAAQHA